MSYSLKFFCEYVAKKVKSSERSFCDHRRDDKMNTGSLRILDSGKNASMENEKKIVVRNIWGFFSLSLDTGRASIYAGSLRILVPTYPLGVSYVNESFNEGSRQISIIYFSSIL